MHPSPADSGSVFVGFFVTACRFRQPACFVAVGTWEFGKDLESELRSRDLGTADGCCVMETPAFGQQCDLPAKMFSTETDIVKVPGLTVL